MAFIDAVYRLTAQSYASYVAKNAIQASGLPDLIASVHAAVASLGRRAVAKPEPQAPAVNPKRSVFPDYIICLDDGKKFKSLKRHLASLGMTLAEYLAKWGLAKDYPMVAPNYAAARSALAKKLGLGRKAAAPATKASTKTTAKAKTVKAPAKAGRTRKAT